MDLESRETERAYRIPASGNRVGRPRKYGVERTPSGVPSRKGVKSPAQYCVYMAYLPSLGILKVGRTSGVDARVKGLKSYKKGENVVVCAEFHVGTLAAATQMEADAIEFLGSQGYEREGVEWFHVGMHDLPSLVDEVERSTSVEILGKFRLGVRKPKSGTRFAYEMAAVSRHLFGHRPQHGRV